MKLLRHLQPATMSPSSYLRIPFKPRHPLPHLSSQTLLTFPTAQIILVTLNRPASLNCISTSQHHELASIWDWMDNEPSIRCGIITGAGQKAFCAGADLKGTASCVPHLASLHSSQNSRIRLIYSTHTQNGTKATTPAKSAPSPALVSAAFPTGPAVRSL